MYEGTATLKEPISTVYDEYGNEKAEYITMTVYVIPRSVYATEFYSAAQAGLQPSKVLIIPNRIDYKGEKLGDYEGLEYDVIRADYANHDDSVSLTLTERIANYGE